MRYRRADPKPGDLVPEFDLPTLGGGQFRSADLAERGPSAGLRVGDLPSDRRCRTFDRSGSRAWRDMFIAAPPLAMMALMMKTLRLRATGAK
jgi:hypothetical protein